MTHLAESRNLLSAPMLQILRQAGAGIFVSDRQGNLQVANERFWEIAGAVRAEEATRIRDLVHPDDASDALDAIRRVIAGEAEVRRNERYLRRDGTVARTLTTYTALAGIEPAPAFAMAVVVDVTAEHNERERLAAGERRYRALVDATGALVWKAARDGQMIEPNSAWEELTGQGPEQQGDGWLDAIHPDDREVASAIWARALADGAPATWQYRVRRRDGDYRRMLVRAIPVRDDAGDVIEFVGTLTDIEDHRRGEEELQTSAAMIDALMASSPVGIAFLDREARYVRLNSAMAAFSGRTPEEHIGRPVGEVQPELWKTEAPYFRQVIETGEAVTEHLVQGTGSQGAAGPRYWLTSYFPVPGVSGEPAGVAVAAIEVTSRIRTEQALAATDARLRALIDATPAMVVMTDAEGDVQIASREWTAFTGLDGEAMRNWREIQSMHPEDAAATADDRAAGLTSLTGYDIDYRLRRADGDYRWVSASVRPALDGNGGLLGWMFVGLDVDDRVRSRQRLEEMNSDLRQLAESIPAIVITSPDDPAQPVFANRLWTEYTGIPLDEVTAESVQRLIHRDDSTAVLEAWERTSRSHDGYEVQFRLRGRDGVYRWFSWRTQPLFDAAHQYLGWITAGVEIDDQVRLREELEVTNEHLRILADAGHAIASAGDYEGAVAAAGDVLVPSFAAWCAVDIVEDDKLVRKLGVHSPDVSEAAARVLRDSPPALDAPDDNLTGVVLSGEGLLIPTMPEDLSVFARTPEHLAAIEDMRPNSSIAVPLRAVGGRTLGVLSLVRAGDQPPFNERDFGTVLELGRRLAASLDRSRLFSQVARALGNLRLLADAGLALSGSRDLDDALDEAANLLVPGYADWCTVDLLRGETIRRVSLAHSPRVDDSAANLLRELRVSREDLSDATARIVATGEPLFLPELSQDLGHLENRSAEYREAAASLRAVSSIGVPLRAGDTVFGVLGLMRVEGREPFDETDLALARELGRQLGGWLERGRLFSELRQALSAKDEFLGFVSHELKTPLTTVVGVSDVLARRYKELDESQRQDAVSLIRRDSLRLEEIIANMLTLARSERPTGDEPTLVQHVVASAVGIHRQRHPHRNVEVALGAGLSPVLAPSGWIDRVVENMLSNAEKYSEPDTPIRLEAEQAQGWVEMRVLDRGRGISEELMRDVFEPFFRADPNEPGVSGVGLGLTVCRRLIERLGGDVWLGPRDGGGTIAGFRVPIMEIPDE